MPRHATKRKQNKRGTKRTGKSFNKRRSVNKRQSRSVKYLGGNAGATVANLQPSILIKSGNQVIAECSVFSVAEEIYIVFQLNKTARKNAVAVAKGLGKAMLNAVSAPIVSTYNITSAFTGAVAENTGFQQKSVTFLLLEDLEKEVKMLTGSKRLTYESGITGLGLAMNYTAETICFVFKNIKYSSDGRTTPTEKFDRNNPNNWLNSFLKVNEKSVFTMFFNFGETEYDRQILEAVHKVQDAIAKPVPEVEPAPAPAPAPAPEVEIAPVPEVEPAPAPEVEPAPETSSGATVNP